MPSPGSGAVACPPATGSAAAGAVSGEMIARMAPDPIVFALANPDPEIEPDAVRAVRPDAIVATGRSDFPNQINNVLAFPGVFRGALDVRASRVTEGMKVAAAHARERMIRRFVRSVIHNATVTHADGPWPVSIRIDPVLLRSADLRLEDGVVKGTATITYRGQEALSVPGDGRVQASGIGLRRIAGIGVGNQGRLADAHDEIRCERRNRAAFRPWVEARTRGGREGVHVYDGSQRLVATVESAVERIFLRRRGSRDGPRRWVPLQSAE